MDEPLATIANSNKKTVPIVWSAEAKDPPNFPFNENSRFLIDIPENAGPTYFFKLFLSDDLQGVPQKCPYFSLEITFTKIRKPSGFFLHRYWKFIEFFWCKPL